MIKVALAGILGRKLRTALTAFAVVLGVAMVSGTLVLTDSGGIQEETTVLGIPCLTLRENTERPITIEQGTNQLVGLDAEKILAAYRRVCAGRVAHRVPDLWDGRAAERIAEIMLRWHARGALSRT